MNEKLRTFSLSNPLRGLRMMIVAAFLLIGGLPILGNQTIYTPVLYFDSQCKYHIQRTPFQK